jgi:hypothetical protein
MARHDLGLVTETDFEDTNGLNGLCLLHPVTVVTVVTGLRRIPGKGISEPCSLIARGWSCC